RVATVQKEIIRRCHQARLPVITATQMLESMTNSRLPTRAEATDVANAVLDGTDALMLSAETAMGQYPVEAVSMMSRIAREAERLVQPRLDHEPGSDFGVSPVTEALLEATSRVADQLQAKLVTVATRSGNTARVLSKQRSRTPILGISHTEPTVRRMCLYWGVTPLHTPEFQNSGELLNHVIDWARRQNLLAPRDRVVLIASTHWTTAGHDMILVHEVS
ncbi:MAG: pyruvate kinase, partial [Planctomycetes bacterium]|nr:pyruvate kinase [Planctomycetota bacterium]